VVWAAFECIAFLVLGLVDATASISSKSNQMYTNSTPVSRPIQIFERKIGILMMSGLRQHSSKFSGAFNSEFDFAPMEDVIHS
jgi:hypothetical protein